MSTLIIEIVNVDDVKNHPNADKLDVCTIKGWQVISRRNQFKKGQKAIYLPIDSLIPEAMAQDRLNIVKYCIKHVIDGKNYYRIRGANLRGERSFGVIENIKPEFNDNINWQIGDNVQEYFGILKYQSKSENAKVLFGQASANCNTYIKYSSPEHWNNFPTALDGINVVVTEKIHGCNQLMGITSYINDNNELEWEYVAGSHNVQRKEWIESFKVFSLSDFEEINVVPNFNDIFEYNNCRYIINSNYNNNDSLYYCNKIDDEGNVVKQKSVFWLNFTDNIKEMINCIVKDYKGTRFVNVYGELYGKGIQSGMEYLAETPKFAAFDIAVNDKYLDFDIKLDYFNKFNVPMVPVFYVGPFNKDLINKFTDGPTTICDSSKIKGFKGREGIVITPRKESVCKYSKRLIFKSISADYLSRNDISDD